MVSFASQLTGLVRSNAADFLIFIGNSSKREIEPSGILSCRDIYGACWRQIPEGSYQNCSGIPETQ